MMQWIACMRSELLRIKRKALLIGGAVSLCSGIFSSALTAMLGGRGFLYYYLRKPPGALPRFFFIIIWSVIYFLIGAAAGAVVCAPPRCCDRDRGRGLLLFTLMMLFNLLWCPLFFAARAFFISLIAVAVMIVLSVGIACHFFRVWRIAGVAIVIYLLWLVYAFYLNFFIFLYNG